MPRAPHVDERPGSRPSERDVARLAGNPLLSMIERPLLERGLERSRLVPCPRGTPVIEEGEYDDRFFVLIEGACEVSVSTGTDGRESLTGWLEGRTSLFGDRAVVAELEAGDFFGELACMSPWPRSSTVTPTSDALVLEVDEDVFDEWRDGSDEFRRVMDEAYMTRGLATAIRRVSALRHLGADDLDELLRSAAIEVHEEGALVVREGEIADAFYLVRGGSAAVSQRADGALRTVSYLRPGSYFGETSRVEGTLRTASVTAATRLELIRIAGAALRSVLARRPEALRRLEGAAKRRAQAAATVIEDDDLASALSFLVHEGLHLSSDVLVVDLARCTRCGLCEAACTASHGVSLIALQGPTLGGHLLPTACRHCADPLCLLRCPVDAIHRERNGEVRLDDHCIGCGRCQTNCPHGTIAMAPRRDRRSGRTGRPVEQQAAKCDLCAGIGGRPRCVQNCATAAIGLLSPQALLRPLVARAS
ncbi:MAG: cyclic nucleotide-binding domain-containing protein [Deltaproteobacteria bacterium]|nr:cyclic nucleotide-binding domain-containing protein [Deltaproteobacteria bacterium]